MVRVRCSRCFWPLALQAVKHRPLFSMLHPGTFAQAIGGQTSG